MAHDKQPPRPPLGESPSASSGEPRRGPRGPISQQLATKAEFERKIKAEMEEKRRAQMKVVRRIGLYIGGGLAVLIALWIVFKPAVECRRSDERKRAFDALLALKDPATGSVYLERFEEKAFRCADHAAPEGTIIGVRESETSEESMVWFVPKGGQPQSVNLLADAWTPRLGAGPELGEADLAKVTK